MKISKYTYLFESNNGEFLVYNSQTNSFLEIYRELFDALNECKNHSDANKLHLEEKEKELLIKHKILISDNESDRYFYESKLKTYANFFNQKYIGLTLVPTTGCNFNCPYCFESNKKTITISDEMINHLIEFLKGHEQAEFISITWYGGEPLMAFKKMKKIYQKIQEETNLQIKGHDIITNGYYINNEVIQFFKDTSLKFIQITLDGNAESHNFKRKLKTNGAPTFDKILHNIKILLKELPQTKIAIRVNIDKNNKNDYYEVYTQLKQLKNSEKLYIYPGMIRIDDEDGTQLGCESLLSMDKSNFYFELSEKKDIYVRFYPQLVRKGCTANAMNSYIIGPSGEIYKCWNDVSNESKIVGYIHKKELTNSDLLSKYIVGVSCFEDEKCKDCFLLPICSGGCAWYRMRNFFEQGKYDICTLYKDKVTFNKCLETYYNNRNNKKYQLNFS